MKSAAINKRARVVTDADGRKNAVLPLADYQKMMEMLEEYEDIRAFDDAKDDEEIPLEQAFSEIEEMHAKRK